VGEVAADVAPGFIGQDGQPQGHPLAAAHPVRTG
jgi:hypothetical protein